MSENDESAEPRYREGGSRRAPKRRNPVGLLVGLLVVVLAVGGLYWGGKQAATFVSDLVGTADDYPGPGTGEVSFEVKQGDSATLIARALKEQGVVASVEAFINAANADPASSGIQVGFYTLKKEMAAADALAVLVDPANRNRNTVTVPEGLRTADILDMLAEKTEFSRDDFKAALRDPALDLPEWTDGKTEGYLFPATYEIGPKDQPADILAAMVRRWRQAADDADLEARAKALGRTPAELMTIASLIQAEGRGDDMPKISRVIWNRLDGPGSKGGTNGLLQIDAAVNYALDQRGTTEFTTEQRNSVKDSPYNLYERVGLPPTPINSPGDAAIEAATHPVDGPWYYYVTVNLKTGETKFAETYDEFLTYRAQYKTYCESSDAC